MSGSLGERYKEMEDHELQELLVRGGLTVEAQDLLDAEINSRRSKGSYQPSQPNEPDAASRKRNGIPWWFWLVIVVVFAAGRAIHRQYF